MLVPDQGLLTQTVETAIARHPLTVSPDTPLLEAIAMMSLVGSTCTLLEGGRFLQKQQRKTSCVVAIEGTKPVGLLTERDIVKLATQKINLEKFTVEKVMSRKLIALNISDFQDIFSAINLLKIHRIRHLPIVNDEGELLGLVTPESLRSALQPSDLLKWRRVEDVMNSIVIHAPPRASVLDVARQMVAHQVSCVAIAVENPEKKGYEADKLDRDNRVQSDRRDLIPQGIITERDIVQFQAMALDLENLEVQTVMSSPLFCLHPTDSLWKAHQQMCQKRVRRLLVRGNRSELAGVITQSSILQALDAGEMFSIIQALQQKVERLQTENIELLENRQIELEQQVSDRTGELENLNQQLTSEIERREQVEAKLRNSECKYRKLVENLPVAIYIAALDDISTTTYISPQVETLLGYSQQEWYANPELWHQKLHPDDRDRVMSQLASDRANNQPFICEYRLFAKNGDLLWLRDEAKIIVDDFGLPLYLQGILYEITPIKQAEEELKLYRDRLEYLVEEQTLALTEANRRLRQEIDLRAMLEDELLASEARLAGILDTATDAIISIDEEQQIILFNKGAETMFGYAATEIIGQPLNKLLPKCSQEVRHLYFGVIEDSGTPMSEPQCDRELGYRRDGSQFPIECSISLLNLGKKMIITTIVRDISDRLLAEKALLESERKYRSLAKMFPNGSVHIFDENFRYTLSEGTILPQLGLSSEMMEGNTIWELLPAETCQTIAPYYQSALEGKSRNFEITFVGVDFLIHVSPLKDDRGKAIGGIVVSQDISDRKRIERALKESQQKYQTLFNILPVGISITDKTGNLVEANPTAEKILQIGDDDGRRRTFDLGQWEVIRADGSAMSASESPCAIALRENRIVRDRLIGLLKPRGEVAWLKVAAAPIPLSNYGVAIAYVDITEHQQTLESLRESEERFRATFEQAAIGMVQVTLDGRFEKVNQSFANFLGYSPADSIGMSFLEVTHPEDYEISQQYVERLAQGEIESFTIEKRYLRSDRSVVWGSLTTTKVYKSNDEPAYYIAAVENINDRKKAEKQLQESEERFRVIFEQAGVGISLCTPEGRFFQVNQKLSDILGYTVEEMLKLSFLQIAHPEELGEELEYARQLVAGEIQSYSMEKRNIRKDSSLVWVKVAVTMVRDLVGEISEPKYFLSAIEDISARKQAEEALRQQLEQERLLAEITERIRQSLKLAEILNTTVSAVREFLKTDRVIIHRFEADGTGLVAVESLKSGWMSILDWQLSAPWVAPPSTARPQVNAQNVSVLSPHEAKGLESERHKQVDRESLSEYRFGEATAIADIYTADLQGWHLQLLEAFQVKAQLVVPLVVCDRSDGENKLWGFLIAHECEDSRIWQPREIDFVKQLATKLAIAIQQASLFEQLEAANGELHRLATVDGLTQVANRRRFDEYIEQEWRRCARTRSSLSLILCDVDFFKLYNDTYGHQAGDECLQRVARGISETVKRPADLVARYGGEEFAVILPNTSLKGASSLAEIIRARLAGLNIPHERSLVRPYVTLSLGVSSTVPRSDRSWEQLIALADEALYRAKETGRDRVEVIDFVEPNNTIVSK